MDFLVRAAIPVAIGVVLALARKYMPVAPVSPAQGSTSMLELEARFGSIQTFVGLSMVLVGVAFVLVTYEAFVWANRYLAAADGPAEMRLWPQSAIWWFFPGFGALCFSWGITLRLWAWLGQSHVPALYNYWSSKKAGFDCAKLLRWFGLLIATPIAIFTVLAPPMRCSLRDADIHDCGYAFAGCQTYRYSDARRMTVIEGFRNRDGKLTRRAGVVIDFSDGRRWSSAEIGDFLPQPDSALLDLLSRKIKLPFNRVQAEGDIPPAAPR
jgi:hypothetical protein